MALIGYARVSTDDQQTEPQIAVLREAGCHLIREEHASGASRTRPVLTRLLQEIRPGDTLVVVRIDRLARSLTHLLTVIEGLEAKGAHFRSLGDPIDTTSPQGKFTLQILGATAEFERSLIRERTRAGLRAARRAGRIGGNPGLKSGDPAARRKLALARDAGYVERLLDGAEEWVPHVRRHRPALSWDAVTALVNAGLSGAARPWTKERLVRATRRYVREGMLDQAVLGRAPRAEVDDRLLAIVAGIKGANPQATLREIGDRLEALYERTPRGNRRWQESSVKMLLDRAVKRGLVSPEGTP